jgi:hypothetical protein
MAIIYGLVHVPSGRVYVGCTKGKPAKRLREHRCLLNQGKHNEPDLQRDWLKDGEGAFKMKVLEQLPIGVSLVLKREAELRWMDCFRGLGLLYNQRRLSFQLTPEAMRKGVANAQLKPGNRWTPEVNEKRRLAMLGRKLNTGPKISATKKRLGQRPSLEAARLGGIAACKKRYAKADEIV